MQIFENTPYSLTADQSTVCRICYVVTSNIATSCEAAWSQAADLMAAAPAGRWLNYSVATKPQHNNLGQQSAKTRSF